MVRCVCQICGEEYQCGCNAIQGICPKCSSDPIYGEMGYFDSDSSVTSVKEGDNP